MKKKRVIKKEAKKEIPQKKKRVTFVHIASILGAIILVALVIFLLNLNPEKQIYEITEVDVLSIPNLEASQVSVKGVELGDSFEEVLNKLGYPDKQQVFPPDIINIEYGKQLKLSDTGLIIHLEGDAVTRITFKEPFNQYLVGFTKVNNTKTQLFNKLGKPDSVTKIPIAEGSFLLMSVYSYKDRGIEFVIRKEEQNALSFVST